ncbi:MAG: alpha/beta hydrolase [Treponema sp.]|jgi:pimeloyl-ACP methyl ester carboxylesterase|nr:alpha/beta hydrolase [Treponema sp.]
MMIDKKCKVTLGGLPQKIHIKSADPSRPVLLFLHGGPGVCNRHAIMTVHADLLDTFTLAAWDQRGSGGSYWGARRETLTVDRLVEDAGELVLWLCGEFKKNKIFIIGGSWGSELGTYLAFRHPEHLAAYVGFGQVVHGGRNEEISYRFCLEAAQKAGDRKALDLLARVGPPRNGMYTGGFKGLMAQRRVMMKYGGYSQNAAKRNYFKAMVLPMILSGEYSFSDFIGAALGYRFVLTAMWGEVAATDLVTACPRFKIPYFIFDGVLDRNTPAELVEEYFKAIEAPVKELIWFEHSGHNPMSDEPEKFKSLLREKLGAIGGV